MNFFPERSSIIQFIIVLPNTLFIFRSRHNFKVFVIFLFKSSHQRSSIFIKLCPLKSAFLCRLEITVVVFELYSMNTVADICPYIHAMFHLHCEGGCYIPLNMTCRELTGLVIFFKAMLDYLPPRPEWLWSNPSYYLMISLAVVRLNYVGLSLKISYTFLAANMSL